MEEGTFSLGYNNGWLHRLDPYAYQWFTYTYTFTYTPTGLRLLKHDYSGCFIYVGSERLTALSQREPKIFHDICLRLDCGGVYNWQDIGEAIGISVDTLEKYERPGEYTDVALQIIHTRRPLLSVGEMKDTIKEMDRGDVLEHLNVLPGNYWRFTLDLYLA